MKPIRGHFQPLDLTSRIGWLWWGVLLLVSLIVWIESAYQITLLASGLLILAVIGGLLLWLRRSAYLVGSHLYLGQIVGEEFRNIDLATDNYRLDKRTLILTANGRSKSFWLSKRLRQAILKADLT